MQHFFLCFTSFLCLNYAHTSGKVYTIVPSQIPPYACSVGSCLTLSQFAENITNYNNTTLIIAGENHYLDAEILVANVDEFFMLTLSKDIVNQALIPTITCTKTGKFKFSNIGSIQIKGLKFDRCNSSKFEFIYRLAIEYATFIDSKSPLTIVNSN